MIQFTSLLFARTTRWVAPVLLALMWTSVAMGRGTESVVARAGGMFLCYAIVGCWTTILVGNVDDDAHRELVTAVVGTRTRLHVMRTATSFLWCAAWATAVTVASLLIHRHAHALPGGGGGRVRPRRVGRADRLEDLVLVITERDIRSIAVPPLGCGNGGLDWPDVRPIIEAKLSGLDVEVLLYPPEGDRYVIGMLAPPKALPRHRHSSNIATWDEGGTHDDGDAGDQP